MNEQDELQEEPDKDDQGEGEREKSQDEAEIVCGPNDDPDNNVGNSTSDVDEDSGRIEEGNTYGEKLEIDLERDYGEVD